MAIVEGRRLALTELERPLYPACDFTKRDAIFYYYCVADALLPHLVDRPVALWAPTGSASRRARRSGRHASPRPGCGPCGLVGHRALMPTAGPPSSTGS